MSKGGDIPLHGVGLGSGHYQPQLPVTQENISGGKVAWMGMHSESGRGGEQT